MEAFKLEQEVQGLLLQVLEQQEHKAALDGGLVDTGYDLSARCLGELPAAEQVPGDTGVVGRR